MNAPRPNPAMKPGSRPGQTPAASRHIQVLRWLVALILALSITACRPPDVLPIVAETADAVFDLLVEDASAGGAPEIPEIIGSDEIGKVIELTTAPGAAETIRTPRRVVDFGEPDILHQETDPPAMLVMWHAESEPILALLTPVEESTRAVLLLSGADGGFYGPDTGFYEQLVVHLNGAGLTTMQVAYRAPTHLEPSVEDALAALQHLTGLGYEEVGVVGFSFGGAVAIELAADASEVVAVLTLASQNAETDRVGEIAPRPVIFYHPVNDNVVPAWAADDLFNRADAPKSLVILPANDHYLTDAPIGLIDEIVEWLVAHVCTGNCLSAAATGAVSAPSY